jgi:hypothetical protein
MKNLKLLNYLKIIILNFHKIFSFLINKFFFSFNKVMKNLFKSITEDDEEVDTNKKGLSKSNSTKGERDEDINKLKKEELFKERKKLITKVTKTIETDFFIIGKDLPRVIKIVKYKEGMNLKTNQNYVTFLFQLYQLINFDNFEKLNENILEFELSEIKIEKKNEKDLTEKNIENITENEKELTQIIKSQDEIELTETIIKNKDEKELINNLEIKDEIETDIERKNEELTEKNIENKNLSTEITKIKDEKEKEENITQNEITLTEEKLIKIMNQNNLIDHEAITKTITMLYKETGVPKLIIACTQDAISLPITKLYFEYQKIFKYLFKDYKWEIEINKVDDKIHITHLRRAKASNLNVDFFIFDWKIEFIFLVDKGVELKSFNIGLIGISEKISLDLDYDLIHSNLMDCFEYFNFDFVCK